MKEFKLRLKGFQAQALDVEALDVKRMDSLRITTEDGQNV